MGILIGGEPFSFHSFRCWKEVWPCSPMTHLSLALLLPMSRDWQCWSYSTVLLKKILTPNVLIVQYSTSLSSLLPFSLPRPIPSLFLFSFACSVSTTCARVAGG